MDQSIPRPPWSKLGRKLESATRKAIYDFSLLDGVDRLGIALSGGKDSLTMLFLLHAISGLGFPPFRMVGLHVEGDYSCGAGVGRPFLANFCDQLGLPLVCRAMPALEQPTDCYTCSRVRRGLLFDMAKDEGCLTVAFGHHRDDNAQTFLMNLFHKGECAGLLPKIHLVAYGVTIIRPIIFLAEPDIKTFALQHGFQRISCRCPVGQHSMRKQVDQWLAQTEGMYPNIRDNVARASLAYGSRKAEACGQLRSSSISRKC